MNTARVSLCLAILLAWSFSPLRAQQSAPPVRTVAGSFPEDDAPEVDDVHTQSLFDNRNYMIRSDAGDGVGYLRGFQTFAAFQPLMIEDNLILWFSPRGYVTYNSGTFGGNLGAGARWLDPATQRILGGGFWWDHDNNGIRQFDQLGGGVESLGNYFDLRANFYYPTNQNVQQLSKFFNNQDIFLGHNIGIGQTTISNSALKGFDFEGGGALPGIGDLGMRAYAGGYYYQGPLSGGGVYGVRGRLEALVTQNIWGTVAVTHDRVFGTNVTAAATIYLGTGQEPRWFQRIPMQTRLFQQMERQYRIAVQQEVENEFILALRNGGTGGSGGAVGTPIFVDHVDNTAAAGGDGSVEHPFNHLPTTTPSNVDIIFVHRGTGTSLNMDQGITLNNFQRLLGDGVVHFFNSTTGTFLLPGFTAGPFPSITNVNPGGSAVTLASHNEVSGFNIDGAALHGITGSNIVDFNINNVNIANSGNSLGLVPIGAGIQLTNATGIGTIFNSTFISNNAEGIRIDNSAGGVLTLAVANVTANRNLTGIELNATGSEIDPTLTNVVADNNVKDGISLSASATSVMTATIQNSVVNSNGQNGIHLADTDSTMNASITGTTINANAGFGIDAVGQGTGLSPSVMNVGIGGYGPGQGNSIVGDHGAGIEYELLDQGTGSFGIIGNTIQGTLAAIPPSTTFLGQGIDVRLTGTTVASNATAALNGGLIDNNQITGNASTGIRLFADQNTFVQSVQIGTLATRGNVITNNGGDGIFITRGNVSQMGNVIPVSIVNNQINDNASNGVRIEALNSFDNIVNGFVVANNQILRNGADGILLHVEADAQMDVDIHANTITSNASNGIQTTEQTGSAGDLRGIGGTWDLNTITLNGGDGISLAGAMGTSLENLVIADGNTIQNNAGHGILVTAPGALQVGFNLIDSNRLGGIYINAPTSDDITIDHNIITNNGVFNATTDGGDGIQVVDANAPFGYVVTITNNSIRANAGRGINILNEGRGNLTVDIENNTIRDNLWEGIYAVNTASTAQSVTALQSVTMDATGSVIAVPRMFLTVNNNDIEGNGIGLAAGIPGLGVASGLVVRVGTSDGNYGPFSDGGFFGEGFGGVGAIVTNNTFHGNLGDDLSFSSFTSTVAPTATAGTWNATTFTITSFQADPLARLDLSFHNNTFDSTPLNVGNGAFGTPTQIGAFYNNAEAAFKSRDVGQTDPGPFPTGGTRDRNAERLAARFGLPPATPGGLSDLFLYPGIGMSTFRLLDSSNGGATTAADVAAAGFLTDNVPFVGPGSANGVNFPNSGASPWGWTFLNGAAPPARPQ